MTILYFIPGHPTRSAIAELLPGRFGKSIATRQTVRGPLDLGAGFIASADGERLALDPDGQTWHLAADGSFAFGWWNANPPTPTSLLRDDHLPGDVVSGWLVPRVRKWHLVDDQIEYYADLPGRATWNGRAWVSGPVVTRYAPVAKLASVVTERLGSVYYPPSDASGEATTVTLTEDCPDLAAQVLMLNYRVGRDELAALEAFEFSFEGIVSILRVFVSLDLFEALVIEKAQKKNTVSAPDTSESTSIGVAD